MSKEHPHAELLRAIADGKNILNSRGERLTEKEALLVIAHNLAQSLSIAPDVIVVNGVEVPAPYLGPMEPWRWYWIATPTHEDYAIPVQWRDEAMNRMWFERGLIHLNAAAAAAHGRAMAAASSQEGGTA